MCRTDVFVCKGQTDICQKSSHIFGICRGGRETAVKLAVNSTLLINLGLKFGFSMAKPSLLTVFCQVHP